MANTAVLTSGNLRPKKFCRSWDQPLWFYPVINLTWLTFRGLV
jgi:hypothetical protein